MAAPPPTTAGAGRAGGGEEGVRPEVGTWVAGEGAPEGMAERVTGRVFSLGENQTLKIGVVTKAFPYWALCASSFRGTVSWVSAPSQTAERWSHLLAKDITWCDPVGSGGPDWGEGKEGTEVVLFDHGEP